MFDGKKDLHGAVQKATTAKAPGFDLAKVGLARCVLDVLADQPPEEGSQGMDVNFHVLFETLGMMQRQAVREFTADKTGTKIKGLKDHFLLDRQHGATRAQVTVLLEEVEATLDNSSDADSVRNHILRIKRTYQLDDKPGSAIADYTAFKEELARFTYTLLNDVQIEPQSVEQRRSSPPLLYRGRHISKPRGAPICVRRAQSRVSRAWRPRFLDVPP